MKFMKKLMGPWAAKESPLSAEEFSTREERRAERIAERQAVAEESFSHSAVESPTQAMRATVRGKSYVYWVPRIEELKRSGRLEEALDLTLECCRAAERDRGGREPAPAYTRHAAIICRKLGYLVDEKRELDRWLSFGFTSKNSQFEERLEKVSTLIEKRLSGGSSLEELTRPPRTIRGFFAD